VKHGLAMNPLRPSYAPPGASARAPGGALSTAPIPLSIVWKAFEERIALVGHDGKGFAFDNEGPRHRVLVGPFSVASRLVTNAEYARFIEDRGYERPELWLSDGWAVARAEGWTAPLYWRRGTGGAWTVFTLHGEQSLEGAAPATHVSFFEADAYARWAEARLPTEQEWEVVARQSPPPDAGVEGHFLDSGALGARPAERPGHGGIMQLFGDAWEWTASAYLPYPKFRPEAGALGEYNGKFMSGQMVLRGGSCLSPRAHLRASYRNFFPPHTRWQMTGIRLARD
jgi:ergothioneine biosynthesis protein EgtB